MLPALRSDASKTRGWAGGFPLSGVFLRLSPSRGRKCADRWGGVPRAEVTWRIRETPGDRG
ncbi:hypothetical protein GCM10010275_39110 [Streptomyces litmocidini]|nr:hypothetical protein GCM10010275_39110 [Streptomyces litmocidini]